MIELYGKAPSADAGREYKSLPWPWQVLTGLMFVADQWRHGKLISDEVFSRMVGCQAGDGLDPHACDVLAAQLELMLDRPALYREFGLELQDFDGTAVITLPAEDSGMFTDRQGRLYSSGMVSAADVATLQLRSAHAIPVSQAREFLGFLRNCGGFEVC